MASYLRYIIDKELVVSIFLVALLNVNKGHCFFYQQQQQQPAIAARPLQGHQPPFYGYEYEPPNRVGYGFKPSWAEIHLQPLIEETPQQQQIRYEQQPEILQRHQQPNEDKIYKNHQQLIHSHIPQPEYSVPPHSYLQSISPEKQHVGLGLPLKPKYQWTVHPSIKYNIPTIPNPLVYREPSQQQVNVLLPLRFFGVQMFPPFIEKLIQRVQTYYSIYNPPETLTLPYSPNTPPTIPTSSLLPPDDTIISSSEEGEDNNILEQGIDNSETNGGSAETPEGETQSPNDSDSSPINNRIGGSSSTETSESSTEPSSEDTTEDDTIQNTTMEGKDEESSTTKNSDDNKKEESSINSTDNNDSDNKELDTINETSSSTNNDENNSQSTDNNQDEITTTQSSV